MPADGGHIQTCGVPVCMEIALVRHFAQKPVFGKNLFLTIFAEILSTLSPHIPGDNSSYFRLLHDIISNDAKLQNRHFADGFRVVKML